MATSTPSIERPTVTIDVWQLRELLGAIKHAVPVSFTSLTDPKPRVKASINGIVTPIPFVEVRKLSQVQAFVGADYEAAVNRQRDREGSETVVFAAKERQWGVRVSPALVRSDDSLSWYIPAHVLRAKSPVFLARKTETDLLTQIPKDVIAPYLPADRVREVAEAQGVERAVVYRNYLLSNLISLSLNGVRYRIERTPRAAMVVRTSRPRPKLTAEQWHELLVRAAARMEQ